RTVCGFPCGLCNVSNGRRRAGDGDRESLSEILKVPMSDNMLMKLPRDPDANELMPDPLLRPFRSLSGGAKKSYCAFFWIIRERMCVSRGRVETRPGRVSA